MGSVTSLEAAAVFVVDDDKSLAVSMSSRLERYGFSAIMAADSVEGLWKSRKNRPDVLPALIGRTASAPERAGAA